MIIPEKYFLYLNILIALVYLFFVIDALVKGFVFELVSMIFFALSVIVSWLASPILADVYPIVKLEEDLGPVNLEPIFNTVIYFVLLTLLLKLVSVIVLPLFKGISKVPFIGGLNRFFGGILGFVTATFISLLICMLLSMPLFKNGKEAIDHSVLRYIDKYSKITINFVVDNVNIQRLMFSKEELIQAKESFKNWLIDAGEGLKNELR